MLLSLMDKLNCLVAKAKMNVFGKSVMDISSLILRADLCGLTAARNAFIDRFDTRKLYVKRTSLRTKLKDSLTVTLLLVVVWDHSEPKTSIPCSYIITTKTMAQGMTQRSCNPNTYNKTRIPGRRIN